MAILIATAFSVLVLGATDTPETVSAQYLGINWEFEVAMAKEHGLENVLICATEDCFLQRIIEQLEELRLPEERQKLQYIERLVELRQRLQLSEGAIPHIQSLDEQAENLLQDKLIELRLYDITYENKFLIMGVAVAVSGIVLVWRMAGKSIDKTGNLNAHPRYNRVPCNLRGLSGRVRWERPRPMLPSLKPTF